MFEDSDPIVEAVTVITSRGHIVEPDDDFEKCRVDGGAWITTGDLLGLNAGNGKVH